MASLSATARLALSCRDGFPCAATRFVAPLARGLLCAAVLALTACAHAPADEPADPLEPVNRAVFTFNDRADHYVLRPVAKGYVYVTPEIVRSGISNFFSNLEEPRTIVNDVLQLKLLQSLEDTGRLVVNTTMGAAGFIDIATRAGLEKHNEDFGQTLGYWGVGEGWYLMLPFYGPSDNRDLIGKGADMPTSPSFYLDGDHDWLRYGASGLGVIDMRAGLLDSDKLMDQQLDKYLFVRTAFLQHRQALVYDGKPPREDYEVYDDEPAPPAKTENDKSKAKDSKN